MQEQLHRITVRNASVASIADVMVITGYVVNYEPEPPPKRDLLRPIEPDEPNTEIEVGYSRNLLEPLTLVYKNRKVDLTKSLFILFRYVYEFYRSDGRTKFEFLEITEALKGEDGDLSKNAIEKSVRRIAEALAKIAAPFSVSFDREVIYVDANFGIVQKPPYGKLFAHKPIYQKSNVKHFIFSPN